MRDQKAHGVLIWLMRQRWDHLGSFHFKSYTYPPLLQLSVALAAYGDSTMWGYKSGIGGRADIPAPAAFAAALPASGNYDVHNEGVVGTTACDLLNGADGKHPAWSSQMAASRAKYVLVNFAINDE